MKIVLLDYKSLGEDLPLDPLAPFGEVEVFLSTNAAETPLRVKDADVLIINKFKMTAEVFEQAKNLKLVCEFATGFDNIDLAAARAHGVAVANVPAYSTDSVALFTLSTALALASHLKEYSDYVRSGEYSASGVPNKLTPVYHELAGKTWGVLGCGNIGKKVAGIAKAFGMEVIATKRTSVPEYRCVDVDTLCKESDVLSIHCPLNDGTRGIINEQRIAMMKKDVILVNEARGAVVDEKAVATAIKEGRIGAFGADVYATEPFGKDHPYYEIKDFDNVLFTPHAAWGSYEARARCLDVITKNIRSFLAGERLNRVD